MKTSAFVSALQSLCLAGFALTSSAAQEEPLFAGRATPDQRVREYILPARILWESPAEACVVQNAQQLLQPFSGQVTLGGGATCVLRNNGKAPGILLDFGRELHGGLQLVVADLRARFQGKQNHSRPRPLRRIRGRGDERAGRRPQRHERPCRSR